MQNKESYRYGMNKKSNFMKISKHKTCKLWKWIQGGVDLL